MKRIEALDYDELVAVPEADISFFNSEGSFT